MTCWQEWKKLAAAHQKDAAHLRRENEQLREALRDIFEELDGRQNAPEHSHSIPGVWDDGEACKWCAKWNQIRTMIS